MKKTLLASAAIAGIVFASAPAQAQMELTIGGHSKNYIGYLDQDDRAGVETRNFDMQRETELHFNGEATLDSGLTFGFQVETEVDGGDDENTIEESYVYMSGTWGRVNLGSEDEQDKPFATLQEVRECAEMEHLKKALVAADWNISKVSRDLATSRTTLYELMEKYQLKKQ